MKKTYTIPTDVQLVKLAQAINTELEDIKKDNMIIVFELSSEMLRQVDEDYFFKTNKDASPNDFEPGDEVNIIVSGINIKFVKNAKESI